MALLFYWLKFFTRIADIINMIGWIAFIQLVEYSDAFRPPIPI